MKEPRLTVERVEDMEAFALERGISVEELQDLIDRIGNDRQALEEAVLIKQAERDEP